MLFIILSLLPFQALNLLGTEKPYHPFLVSALITVLHNKDMTMKKSILVSLLSVLLVVVCGLFFWLGKQTTEREKKIFAEGLSLNELGNTLLALRYFDKNQPNEAQRLLQAETNGQLSWLIALEQANGDPEFRKQRCKVLNTLKQYREKHQLFKTNNWDDLRSLPGAKEEEEKRGKYLAGLACGNDVFFRIQPE